jgi:hypothetical protein
LPWNLEEPSGAVLLGRPAAVSVWISTVKVIVAPKEVESDASETRSSWPVMPAVNVWAMRLSGWKLVYLSCCWSSVSAGVVAA